MPDTYDPIGPGTPAWEQFDNALTAYAQSLGRAHYSTPGRYNRPYKRYANCRQQMVRHLQKAGASKATVRQWTADLIRRAKSGDFDECHLFPETRDA